MYIFYLQIHHQNYSLYRTVRISRDTCCWSAAAAVTSTITDFNLKRPNNKSERRVCTMMSLLSQLTAEQAAAC